MNCSSVTSCWSFCSWIWSTSLSLVGSAQRAIQLSTSTNFSISVVDKVGWRHWIIWVKEKWYSSPLTMESSWVNGTLRIFLRGLSYSFCQTFSHALIPILMKASRTIKVSWSFLSRFWIIFNTCSVRYCSLKHFIKSWFVDCNTNVTFENTSFMYFRLLRNWWEGQLSTTFRMFFLWPVIRRPNFVLILFLNGSQMSVVQLSSLNVIFVNMNKTWSPNGNVDVSMS